MSLSSMSAAFGQSSHSTKEDSDRREKVHTEEDSVGKPFIVNESPQDNIHQDAVMEYDPTFGLKQSEIFRSHAIDRVQQTENELGVASVDFFEMQNSAANEQRSPSEVRNRNTSSTLRDCTFGRVEKALDTLGAAARDAVDGWHTAQSVSQDKDLGE